MLAAFGLTTVAQTVYRVMLRHPRLNIHEVITETGLSDAAVHMALDELAKASLISSSWDEPGALRAVPPQVGLAALLASQERELRDRQERVSATKLALEQAIDQYQNDSRKRPYEGVEQLIGMDSIRSRIESLAAECEKEILAFAPGGPQTLENRLASAPIDLAVLARGIRMRTVYLDSLTQDSASLEYANWLCELGAEIRTLGTVPLRMIIYDRQHALLPMDPEDTAAGAVLLSGTGVVIGLCELFEQIWASARPIGPGQPHVTGDLTSQEQAVLALLSQGHTDDVVARRLGVSVRTGRRITATLMARLDARSRFQAGVNAVRRGWLDAPSTQPGSPG